MASWLSIAARVVWGAVGGKLILLPTVASGALFWLERSKVLPEGGIPVSWIAVAAPLLIWVVGGLVVRATVLQRQIELDPEPNMPAPGVFRYLLGDSEMFVGQESEHQTINDLVAGVTDAACIGKIHVWGRSRDSNIPRPLSLIAEGEWHHERFNVFVETFNDSDGHTKRRYAIHDTSHYNDVQFNKQEVLARWKKTSWTQRLCDKGRSMRLALIDGERINGDG